MRRRLVNCAILICLASYLGCYSYNEITHDELVASTGQTGIRVYLRDLSEYDFDKGRYFISGDSLSGAGMLTSSNTRRPGGFKGTIALADISKVEERTFSTVKTLLLAGGAVVVFAGAIYGATGPTGIGTFELR